ncbi:MAG: hypothetical protein QXF35_00295 [Candidatus Bilamarchaeaceae archaeon]
MFRKGQYFSFDAIIASVIFMMAVVMLLSYWHSVRTFLEFQGGDMTKEAMRISATLFSPYPSGIIISSSDRRVNASFMNALPTNTENLKSKFATPYNMQLVVTEVVGGSTLKKFGDNPPQNTEVVKIRRIGSIVDSNGKTTIATFDIYLYR